VRWGLGVGIDLVRGRGRLDGERTVLVVGPDGDERTLTARHAVVLDTGSTPFIPPVHGLRDARPWNSRDVTNIHEVPDCVVVVGGGVVACEAATWLRALGVAEITVVQRGPRLLARTEPFVGELVAAALHESGVVVRLRTSAVAVSRDRVNNAGVGHVHGGEVTVTLSDGRVIVADEIVVATGRTPNSHGIGLETVGLEIGQDAPVPVDDHMTVTGVAGGWLYAIGDLTGRALLTHMGKYQARIAGNVIAARAAGQPLDDRKYSVHTDEVNGGRVPQVIFTDPEVGAVGLTEAEARERGLDVEVVEYDLAQLAGTYLLRQAYTGRAKLVLDRSSDVVVGATFVGTGVAELTHSATMAVVGKVPVPVLWHVVPSYPTVSEAWLRLLENLNAARQTMPAARPT
jgi:dihydrolipoamide dehydrogenase